MSGGCAIRGRDVGIRFMIRHQRAPTIHSGLVRALKRAGMEEFWALRKVSFEVPVGSAFGMIGANGSGKSTLLRVLARILAPDEGEIEIRGRASALISLGAGFEPELSGRENIFFNGMLLGLSREEINRRLDAIIAFADLPGTFIDAPVRTYSSGMRARVGFSVAVHVDPEILIVDEVLTVGDARFRTRCKEKFQELFSRGTTVVMVQHNLDTILELCDQAMWLDRGHPQAIGAPATVVRAYLESQGLDPERTLPALRTRQAAPAGPAGLTG
ncbi:MAG: ABC transporter ATP-binding protein [Acidobacteria bacterium]|nr:ABC transporter ATP-binding protein [Acidobacteriota bacterium]